jgi:hypothetical protein
MSAGTPVTREGVDYAYRLLLGREPESEKAIAHGLEAGTLEALRRRVMASPEFAQVLERETPHALRRMLLARSQAETEDAAPAIRAKRPRIVFLHIMKTAGSSVRARLEQLADGAPVWRREADGLPGAVPPAQLAPYRVIMGHFTIRDALHVPAPRRIFTVLRDPVARIVSYYHFMHRHRAEAAEARNLVQARIARDCTLEQFLAHPSPQVRDALQNVITRSLAGDYRLVGRDRYAEPWQGDRDAISGPALLARALKNLLALDYVAFVERLEEDRPKLMKALGLPDPGPFGRENTAETENDTLESRPPPVVTPAAERLMHRLTDLDRLLYRLARMHCG